MCTMDSWEFLFWFFILPWSLSAIWIIEVAYREWPNIESDTIREDARFAALGCVPRPFKIGFFIILFVGGPFFMLWDLRDRLRLWAHNRRVRRMIMRIDTLLADTIKQTKNQDSRKALEKAQKTLSDLKKLT